MSVTVQTVAGSLYYYAPSLAVAIVFAILFFLLGSAHLYRTALSSSWRFTFPIIICCFELVAGFALRAVGSSHYTSLGLFVGEQVCVQVAPPLLALALYLTLGRTLYYVPWLSPIHPGRVRTTFILLDAAVAGLMGAGVGKVANSELSVQQRDVGTLLVRAGMVLQCVLIISFLGLCSVFTSRCRRRGVLGKVKKVLVCVYACAGCILLRTVVRTVEYFQAYLTPLTTHEAAFYTLDILWVLLGAVIYLALFPGALLPKSQKIYLALDGQAEREGPGWDDQRPWIVTLVDPFNLTGNKGRRFWEEDDDALGTGTKMHE